MTQVLKIVDNSGTELFNLNGSNGTDAGSVTCDLLQILNLSVGQVDYERVNSTNAPGGTTVRSRAVLTPFTVPIRLKAASYDLLRQGVARLSALLADGCVMQWQANGSLFTRYIDVEPSQAPALIDGRELTLHDATTLFDTPTGVQLNLTRQPYLRGAELDPTVNQLRNPTLLRDTPVDGTPDDWAWSSTSNITNQQIVTTTDDLAAFQFDIAVAATRGLRQTTGVGTAAPGDVKVVSFYARVTSGSMTNMQAEALYQFYQSDGTTVVGSETSGGLTTLTTAWQRISVVSSAAGALTSRYRANLRISPTSAVSATVQFKFAQGEDDAITTFRTGLESPSNDPIVAPGRVVFFYNAGELPAPVRGYYAGSGSIDSAIVAARTSLSAAYANNAFKQAEAMTQGTNTATAAGGVSYSGAGSNVSDTTFGTNNLTVTRLTWTLSASELAAAQGGRHQVWIRAGTVTGTTRYNIQVAVSFGGASFRLPYVVLEPTATAADLYLGTFTVPSDASTVVLTFHAERVSGSTDLRWDFAHLVPTDSAGIYRGGGSYSLLESDPTIPRIAAVSSVAGAVTAVGSSQGPVAFWATPGLNAVYVVRTIELVGNSTSPAWNNGTFAALDVSFYYAPRYYL